MSPRLKYVVLDVEQIGALRSKLRAQIVDLIYNVGEMTAAQIGEELNQNQTTLYRHLDVLVDVGLLIEGEPVRSGKNTARVFEAPGKTLKYVEAENAPPEMLAAVGELIEYELKLAGKETARAYTANSCTSRVPSAHLKYASATGWLSAEERTRVNDLLDEINAIVQASSHAPGKDLQTISFAFRPAT